MFKEKKVSRTWDVKFTVCLKLDFYTFILVTEVKNVFSKLLLYLENKEAKLRFARFRAKKNERKKIK